LSFCSARNEKMRLRSARKTGLLAAEVTPRFPDGLTVFTGQGQWRAAGQAIIKETSRMLVIWYEDTNNASARIEAIRAAYKARFRQASVLRADGESCVSF
jgi:hypothetical protein